MMNRFEFLSQSCVLLCACISLLAGCDNGTGFAWHSPHTSVQPRQIAFEILGISQEHEFEIENCQAVLLDGRDPIVFVKLTVTEDIWAAIVSRSPVTQSDDVFSIEADGGPEWLLDAEFGSSQLLRETVVVFEQPTAAAYRKIILLDGVLGHPTPGILRLFERH